MTCEKLKTLYSRNEIARRIKEIGAQINTDYAGKDLTLVCVLKGAFMFFSDLAKELALDPEIDFVRVSSYGNRQASSGLISFTKDIEINIVKKHVIVVEDIVDTGLTVDFLFRQFSARGAASVKIATLLNKAERRRRPIEADYIGFEAPDSFVVGYGLDYAEKYREVPEICILEGQ